MKLTDSELQLFRELSKANAGDKLVEFFDRFLDEFCDLREIEDINEGALSARRDLAKMIEVEVIQRLKNKNESRSSNINEYV